MTEHEHEFGQAFEYRDVEVMDGRAVMPDGRAVESRSNVIRYTVPLNELVCAKCGERRPTGPDLFTHEPESYRWPEDEPEPMRPNGISFRMHAISVRGEHATDGFCWCQPNPNPSPT